MTDIETKSYIMYGAREALNEGMANIKLQIEGIERAIYDNPGLAFDLAKTLIESACKTILSERNIEFDNGDNLPKLFKKVTNSLHFLPSISSGDIEARRSLERILSGLSTSLHGVCELRNHCGFASHGDDSVRPFMMTAQALLATQAADAIVGFLHRVHQQEKISGPVSELNYKDNEAFNNYVDEANELVRIFDLEYRPSDVLFSVDQEAYNDLLAYYLRESVDESYTVEDEPTKETPE